MLLSLRAGPHAAEAAGHSNGQWYYPGSDIILMGIQMPVERLHREGKVATLTQADCGPAARAGYLLGHSSRIDDSQSTSAVICLPSPHASGGSAHQALLDLSFRLAHSRHGAVLLQTVQELYDCILDMPPEVLQGHRHLVRDLATSLKHAETGSAVQIAVRAAMQAFAMSLSSANEIAMDESHFCNPSLSGEHRTGQTLKGCMENPAAAQTMMTCVKSATGHAGCFSALQDLHRLVSTPKGACAAAEADWLGAFEHLLSACPITRDDRVLWLSMSDIMRALLGTHKVSAEQLMALAGHCGNVMVPMISRLASEAPLAGNQQLPLSLAHEIMDPYTTGMLKAAQEAAEKVALTRCLLDLLAQVLHVAHEACDSALSGKLLLALNAEALVHALASLYIAIDTASYGTRCKAMLLLTHLVRCVGDTWRFTWSNPGSQWDAALEACLGPIVRHVCSNWHRRPPGSFRGRALLEQALHCLTEITRMVPARRWAPAWQQVGGTYWLTNLARRDREWQVRACALGLLSRLASPVAPAMQCMLLQAWRDGPAIAAQIARDASEVKQVRAAAVSYLTATFGAWSATATQPSCRSAAKMSTAADIKSAESLISNLVPIQGAASTEQRSGFDTEESASASDACCRVITTSAHEEQSQHIWDLISSLLKDGLEDPCMARALTGLLLQASLADADALHEYLRQSGCWPDLLRTLECAVLVSPPARGNQMKHNGLSLEPELPHLKLALRADAAANVGQLLTVLVQSSPAASAAFTSSPAFCRALLHCYGGGAKILDCSDWDLHWRQMAMLQHIAQAIAAISSRDDLATQDVIGMLQGEAEAVATSAALLMSSTPCRVPVRTKLATCSLLTAVLSSKEAAAAVLLDPTGEEWKLPHTKNLGICVGAILCSSLTSMWSSPVECQTDPSHHVSDQERSRIAVALSAVLAFSSSAKKLAVETGLHVSLIAAAEDARARMACRARSSVATAVLHRNGGAPAARTALSALANRRRARTAQPAQQSKPADRGKKSHAMQQSPAGHQLHWVLMLLKHLVLDSRIAQASAAEAGGMKMILNLWELALVDRELLPDLLGLLRNMVADSVTAQRSFCSQGALERILKLVYDPHLEASIWAPSWAVLQNMAASSHGTVALLKRASLLPDVLQLTHDLARRKQWLKLPAVLAVLANISAHAEGQRALLKSAEGTGLLDLLVPLTQVQHHQTSSAAVLFLHALAHAAEAGAHFLAHSSALPCLVECLGTADSNSEAAAYAASALWALTHNCQKVKGALLKIASLDRAVEKARSFFWPRIESERKEIICDTVHAVGHQAVVNLAQIRSLC